MDEELQVTIDAMRRVDSRGAGRFERGRGSRARTTSRVGSDVTQYELLSLSERALEQSPSTISPVTEEWLAKRDREQSVGNLIVCSRREMGSAHFWSETGRGRRVTCVVNAIG